MSEGKIVTMSYGGGIQSTAIAHLVINKHPALMSVTKNLPTAFYFADTGDEPESVYKTVDQTTTALSQVGLPLFVVKKESEYGESISEDILNRVTLGISRGGDIPPVFTRNPDGTQGHVQRQCTASWKVDVLERAIKKHAGLNLRMKAHQELGRIVEQWIGISLDEASRMRDPRKKWFSYFYPLVEMGWTRQHCVDYLDFIDVKAARSACVYCPYHSNREWVRLKNEEPEAFDRAVEFERKLHAIIDDGKTIGGLTNKPFLHRSMVPVEQAVENYQEELDKQPDLFGFDDECAGVCGV